MKQQQGFTLIELIIVIVILGILAVTAAPRFIDIQSDARSETLQGVKAAVQGASQLVYAKAAIAGVQNADGDADASVTINGETVDIVFGYPDASRIDTVGELDRFVDIDFASQLSFENPSDSDNTFIIRFTSIPDGTDGDGNETGCKVTYVHPAARGATPTFTVLSNGC